jgi:hypothetical protein
MMSAEILVHDIVAVVIVALELTDQHIQQRHVGTIRARHTTERTVHKTAQRKDVDEPFQHRLTEQR